VIHLAGIARARVGLAIAGTLLAAVAAAVFISTPGISPDFDVFWGAQHTDAPYDPAAVGEALKVVDPSGQPRLFAYAPTFLVLSSPLRLFASPHFAYVCWVSLSALALLAAARSRLSPLLLLSPAVVFAGLSGQTTLLVGAGLLAGLSLLGRPILAGAMIGLAICVKPQIGLLVPFGLVMAGEWRAGAAVVAMGALVSLAATLAFGPSIWLDWVAALPGFLRVNWGYLSDKELIALPGWVRGLLLAMGCLVTWGAFRTTQDPAKRMIAAVVPALLAAPHAIKYDVAALAPAALWVARERGLRMILAAAFLAVPATAVTLVTLAFCALPGGQRATGGGEAEPAPVPPN
jgi:hypothetical protein